MQGRLLVFAAREGRLVLVSERETHGAVYNVAPFHGRLLAGINSRIQLFK